MLHELKSLLQRTGVLNLVLLFGEGNQRSRDWKNAASRLSGGVQTLVFCFFNNEKVPEQELRECVPARLLTELVERGVIVIDQGYATAQYRLVFYRRVLLWMAPDFSEPKLKENEFALIRISEFEKGESALILFSPSGVAAIAAALSGMTVTVRSQDFYNKDLLQLNCELNDVSISLIDSDVIAQLKFDKIYAAPPYCLRAEGLNIPEWADGGVDGAKGLEESIAITEQCLNDSGSAFIAGVFYGNDVSAASPVDALFSDEKRSSFQCQTFVTSRFPMTPTAGGLVYHTCLLIAARSQDALELHQHLDRHLKNNQISQSFMFVSKIEREAEQNLNSLFIDLSDEYYGTWNI